MDAEEADLRWILERELASGASRIVLPPGRYPVTPRNRGHVTLEGLADVEIVAEGVELVCTETTRALTLAGCRNVRVVGLTIDYDPLPFSQGRITALSEDKRDIDVELFEGYPTEGITATKFEIFDPESGLLRCHTYHQVAVRKTGERTLRVHKTRPYDPRFQPEQVGDIVVIAARHAPRGSIPHAVYLSDCDHVVLEGVTLYASPVFGFMENGCTATHYLRCRIDRRAPEDDPVARGCRRFRSLNADGFHSNRAPTGPRIESCVARFQGDDCVNIHGDYHVVASQEGRVLRVLAKRDFEAVAGDTVELVSFSGRRLPDARVAEVSAAGEVTEADRALLTRLRLLRPQTVRQAFRVVLTEEVEVESGSVLACTKAMGNGFAVVDNTFGHIRSRGILVKARDGEIRGNTLTGCWSEAIKVAPEVIWLESGSSEDVVIRDNVISGSHAVSIAAYALAGTGEPAPAGVLRRITITGNRIVDGPMPGILLSSIKDRVVADNVLSLDPERVIMPWQINRFRIAEKTPVAILRCEP